MWFSEEYGRMAMCLYQADIRRCGVAEWLSASIRLIHDDVVWRQARNLLSACMRLIHEAVRVAAPGIRLIHEDQLASRRISLING